MNHLSRFSNNKDAATILANCDSLISVNSDVTPIIHNCLDSVITKDNKRGDSIEVLAMYSSHESYARLSSNVDKLPMLVESADRNEAERAAMVEVFSNILTNYNSDVSTQLPKILTKLVGVACRISMKGDSGSSMFGLRLLSALVQEKSRPLMLPYAKQIRNTCIQIISDKGIVEEAHINLLSEVYAVYTSIESAEAWSGIWCDAVKESCALLNTLGIGAGRSSTHSGKKGKGKTGSSGDGNETGKGEHLVLLANSGVLQQRGVVKAIQIQRLYRTFTGILSKLLQYGCSSGFVALNVTQFLPMLQLLLSASAEVSLKDPVSYIEGDASVAPVDVVLVISMLKVDLLSVVSTLLSIDHPALIRIGSSLLRPVAALLSRSEGKSIVRLNTALLRCLAAAARALPSVLAASLNSSPIGLTDMLLKEVSELTVNQSLLSQSQAATDAKESNKESGDKDGNLSFRTGVQSTVPTNLTGSVLTHTVGSMEMQMRVESASARAARLKVIFDTCEAVLLFSGPLLGTTVREAFTSAVQQALACLSLGILTPQYTDRHMHRNNGAILRQDPHIQCMVLQLATVEVFSPPQLQHQAQQFSRNLPLLKRCAELCLRNATTAPVAARTLLQFSTLFHPVTVALPAVPAVDSARSYILSVVDAVPIPVSTSASAPTPSHQEASVASPMLAGVPELFSSNVVTSADVTGKNNNTGSASAGEMLSRKLARDVPTPTADDASNKKARISEVRPALSESDMKVPTVIATGRVAVATAERKTVAADDVDDDVSLPDIDIDADPDSD